MVPQGGDLRRHRQPVQSRHPLCPRHRRAGQPAGILPLVRAGRGQWRQRRRQEARRGRLAARPEDADDGQASGAELHARARAGRGDRSQDAAGRLGPGGGRASSRGADRASAAPVDFAWTSAQSSLYGKGPNCRGRRDVTFRT